FLPGTRRRGQLALPADEAAVFVPVMMAARNRLRRRPRSRSRRLGSWFGPNARGCRVARGCAARGEGPLMIRQIRRPHAPLSPSANLCAPRYHARSFHPSRLGGRRRFHAAAGVYTAAGTTEAIDQAVRRRDDGAGARSRARAHQERAALGLCARRRPSISQDSAASSRPLPTAPMRKLAQQGDVALVLCWSHVRRQFYEIQMKTPAPIATTQALVRIAALYAIEADIRGLSADERRQARQRRAKPLIDDFCCLRISATEIEIAAVAGFNELSTGAADTGTRLPAEGQRTCSLHLLQAMASSVKKPI